MKTDIQGCSTCQKGQEHYEDFWDIFKNKYRVQYDYRTPEGKLFSCVADDLDQARIKREVWLRKQEASND